MILNFNYRIFFHSLSLCSLVALLIATNVNSWILLLAIGLIFANIYNIVKMMINYEEEKAKFDVKASRKIQEDHQKNTKFDSGLFEQKVRLAYQKNLSKNSSYIEEENNYWNSSYFNRSDKAEQLRNLKISDIRKDRRVKFDEICFKQEGITSKKIRNFFQIHQKEDDINIKLLNQLVSSVFTKLGDSLKKTSVSQIQVKEALLAIDTYVNNKISNNYEKIANDFNEVNRFLLRCFSMTFAFNDSGAQSSLNYIQLNEIIDLIQKKQVIPQGYTSSFTPFQIKKEIALIRKNLNDLPNFCVPKNVLKLSLFMKYLQGEFKKQSIVLSRFDVEERIEGNCHLLKSQENGKVYYNRQPNIKSRYTATPILVLIIHNFGQLWKENRPLMKQIRLVFNL